MKRPAFQFYPADWRKDANLRRCSPAARGVWMDILCVLHDAEPYGVAHWPLKDLALAAGAAMPHVRELVEKCVLKGCDKGACAPLVYVPRHGRKEGAPVTLIEPQDGPIWYSARFVRDEYVRTVRGESSRFGEGNGDAPKPAPKAAPKPPIGDGASTSSSSSSSSKGSVDPASQGEDSLTREAEEFLPPVDPTAAGLACKAMREAGLIHVNPSHPELLDAIAEGVTAAEFRDAAAEFVAKGKPNLSYVVAAVRGRRRVAAEKAAAERAAPPGSDRTSQGPPPPRRPQSKTMSAILVLEGMKSGNSNDSVLVPGLDHHGTAAPAVPVARREAGGGNDCSDGGGLDRCDMDSAELAVHG